MTRRRPTIADVAAAAGVSKATVSKALSLPEGECPVNADTRQHVRAVAERLGYHPGWLATALNRGRTGVVALLYSRPAPPMTGQYHEIVVALHAGLQAAGYDLAFQRIDEDPSRCLDLVRSRRYDGLVILEHQTAMLAEAMRAWPVPAVRLNADGDPALPLIEPDDRQACALAVAHLLGLGHRRIVYWHGLFIDDHPSTRLRAREVLAGVAAGGGRAEEVVAEADALAAALADGTQPATAVLCFHEMIAARLLQSCWRAKVAIPGRVSVLTFNDSYLLDLTIPPLTCIALPAKAMGEATARAILDRIAGRPAPATVALPSTLLMRASTAAPA